MGQFLQSMDLGLWSAAAKTWMWRDLNSEGEREYKA